MYSYLSFSSSLLYTLIVLTYSLYNPISHLTLPMNNLWIFPEALVT